MLTTLQYLVSGIVLATSIYALMRTAVFARRVYPGRFHLGRGKLVNKNQPFEVPWPPQAEPARQGW